MRYVIIILLIINLGGCATTNLKAPCDYEGHFCGRKIQINQ